ncbi:sulfatase [bacterium]|nr:sulfatase [bacterium]
MGNIPVTRRNFIKKAGTCGALMTIGAGLSSCTGEESPVYPKNGLESIKKIPGFGENQPNIIIINADDLGYGDLGCYGSRAIKTPHIDTLARDGVRFTDFHACDSVCSPSRAGLLTGRYPKRMGLDMPLQPENLSLKESFMIKLSYFAGDLGLLDVATNSGAEGLNPDEITIAEALKTANYKTGMVGKWHLGDYSQNPMYNPVNHGFDYYFGVPHSNDMTPFPLYRNEEKLEAHVTDQSKLTRLYTEEAVKFIDSSKDKPFFLYLAHTFPHRPLYASNSFQKTSEGGTFGDTVEELDWSMGEILATLSANNLDDNTLIVFTSDNGPWYQGSPGGLRGRKGQSFEGGHRVPFIARFKGHIKPGGTCSELAMNIDLFATSLAMVGLELPADRVIDGKNIMGLLTGTQKESPHDALFFYHHGILEGVRAGHWKYFRSINHYTWPLPVNKKVGKLSHHLKGDLPLLHNLKNDPDESYNLINKYPHIGEQLEEIMSKWETLMKNNPVGLVG